MNRSNFNTDNIVYPLDVREAKKQFQAAQAKLFLKLAEAEEKWYDDCLKAVMPETIYVLKPKMFTDRTARRKFLCWTKKRDVRVEVDQDNTKRLMMGNRIIGEFSVKFDDGKVNITAKTIPTI